MARILLIEDDEQARQLYCEMLQRGGHEVVEAANGAEGMSEIKRSTPDLVITDLVMPVKEGLETITELRHAFPQLRVIAMSGGLASGGVSFLPAAKMLGAVRTLQKPFRLQELLTTVDEVLSA